MKKILSIIISISSFVIIGMSPANATPEPDRVAIVDVNALVTASSQVKALKIEQEKKNKELVIFMKKAQTDLSKQTDEKKKIALAKSYQKQFTEKKEANLKAYTTKLKLVDKYITDQVAKKATELGYTVVLPKNTVVFGGTDITNEVLKVIK